MPLVESPTKKTLNVADWKASLEAMGYSPEEVKRQLYRKGFNAREVEGAQPNVPFKGQHQDDIDAQMDKATIPSHEKRSGVGAFIFGQPDSHEVDRAAREGMLTALKATNKAKTFVDDIAEFNKRTFTDAVMKTGNLLEVAGGVLAHYPVAAFQVPARKLSRDFSHTKVAEKLGKLRESKTGVPFEPTPKITWAEAWAQSLPEFYGKFTPPTDKITGDPNKAGENPVFLESLGQLGDILRTAGGALYPHPFSKERWHLLGKELAEEPMVFEREDQWYSSLNAMRDALGHKQFDDYMATTGTVGKLSAMGVGLGADIFLDPAMGVYLGAGKGTKGVKYLKDFKGTMKSSGYGWKDLRSAADIKDIQTLTTVHQAERAAKNAPRGIKELHYAENLAARAVADAEARKLSRYDQARARAALARTSAVRDAMTRYAHSTIKPKELPRKMPIRNIDAPLDNAKIFQQLRDAKLGVTQPMEYSEWIKTGGVPMVRQAVAQINSVLGPNIVDDLPAKPSSITHTIEAESTKERLSGMGIGGFVTENVKPPAKSATTFMENRIVDNLWEVPAHAMHGRKPLSSEEAIAAVSSMKEDIHKAGVTVRASKKYKRNVSAEMELMLAQEDELVDKLLSGVPYKEKPGEAAARRARALEIAEIKHRFPTPDDVPKDTASIPQEFTIEYRDQMGKPRGRAVIKYEAGKEKPDAGKWVLSDYATTGKGKEINRAKDALLREAYALGARGVSGTLNKSGAIAFHAYVVKKAAIEGRKIPKSVAESFKTVLAPRGDASFAATLKSRLDKLSPDVHEYLRKAGANLPEHPGVTALRDAPSSPGEFIEQSFDNLLRRDLGGPPDWEWAGDALRRLQLGADGKDITIGQQLPEYRIFGQTTRAQPDPGDLFILGQEAQEMKPRDFYQIFPEMWKEGLAEKSIVPRLFSRLTSGLGGFVTTWEALLREPSGTIPKQAEILIAAMHKFDLETSQGAEHFKRVFANAGILNGKKTDMAKSEELFELLDLKASLIADGVKPEAARARFQKVYATKSREMQTAHDEVRLWLDVTAKRLGIPADDFIEGYVRHLFDPADFADGYQPLALQGLDSMRMVGKHPRLSHLWGGLMEREDAEGYGRDIVAAMDEYLRGAMNEIHLKPSYAKAIDSAEKTGDDFTKQLVNRLTDEMKGRPALVDRSVEQTMDAAKRRFGGQVDTGTAVRKSLAVTGLFYTGLLAGRMKYILSNLGAATLNNASKYGILNTSRGFLAMASPKGRQLAKEMGIAGQWEKILENARFEFAGRNVKLIEGLSNLGPNQSEFLARGVAFYAALSDITRTTGKSIKVLEEEGLLSRALYDATRGAEKVQHIYGVLGRPIGVSSISKALSVPALQFLSWGPKQLGMLNRQWKEDPGVVIRYFMLSGLAQKNAANAAGLDIDDITGVGFVPAMLRDGVTPESPGVALLKRALELNELLADNIIGGKRDPDKLNQGFQAFVDAATPLVPLELGVREAARTVSDVATGEEFNPATGAFQGTFDRSERAASFATGLPSRQAKRRRELVKEIRERALHNTFRKQQLVENTLAELNDHLLNGRWPDAKKQEEIKKMMGKLEEEGLPVEGVDKMFESRYQLYAYSERLRAIMDNEYIWAQIEKDVTGDLNLIDMDINAIRKTEVRKSIQEGYSK